MICTRGYLRFFLIAVALATAALTSCSLSPNAGGSTDTETGGVVAGIVLDNNGKGAAEVSVTLFPASHNPRADQSSAAGPSTVITDENGAYRIVVDSITRYNIYGVRAGDRKQFLHTGIVPDRTGTVRDTGRLALPGYLMVVVPDTFDTSTGFFYFAGTPAFVEMKNAVPFGAGHFAIAFDSLPSGVMPPLVYAQQGEAGVEMATSLQIAESDSVVFTIGNATVKPIWKFTFLVGVKDTISRYFGGISGIAPLISAQIKAATDSFTKEHRFNAAILFSADSFYEYSGVVDDEGPAAAPGRFHYRLLYDDEKQPSDRNDIVRFSYIYLSSNQPDTLFGKRYTGYLTKLFGELRGALNLSSLLVDSTKNSINNLSFGELPSIMNNPLKYQQWDDYTLSIINYNADHLGSERDILATAFPDTIGIRVTTADGSGVSGAEVHIYGSALNTRAINKERVSAGLTNSNGTYVFPRNPFTVDSTRLPAYGNLLIVVTLSGDTTFAWFPLYEAGNAWFADPDASFYKKIGFP